MAKKRHKYKQTYKKGSEADKISQGKIIYQKCQKIMDTWESVKPKSVAKARAFFEHELSVDEEGTFKLLAEAPEEALENVEKICTYGVGSKQHDSAMRDLIILFSNGEVPTSEDMREAAEAMEEAETYEPEDEDFQPISDEDIPDEFL